MSSVDKNTKSLDDKKEAVVTMILLERKLLTTEKVASSEDVHKHNTNFDDKKEVVFITTFSNRKILTTEKVTTSEEVDKVTEKLEEMKEAVVTICSKDLDKFEGNFKVSTGWFNLDHEFFF